MAETSQSQLSIQIPFSPPKDPISEASLKLGRIRTRSLKQYHGMGSLSSAQLLQQPHPNQNGSSPLAGSPYSLLFPSQSRAATMNGAMRWSKIEPHYPADQLQPFVPFRSHQTLGIGDKIIIHGDTDDDVNLLLVFDASSMCWVTIRQSGDVPPSTKAHSLTYIGSNLSVMFGGGKDEKYYDHLYILDLNRWQWKKISCKGKSPSARRAHAAVYDKSRNKLYVFGGGDGISALSDLWALDLKDGNYRWEEIIPSTPTTAEPRGYPTMNLVDDKLIIFGGSDGHQSQGALLMFDLQKQSWSKLYDNPERAIMGHSSLIIGHYLFIVAGCNGSNYSNEIQIINLLSFQAEAKRIAPTNMTSRAYHSCVFFDSRVFLFGGFDGKVILSDIWALELASQAFLVRIPAFKVGSPGEEAKENPADSTKNSIQDLSMRGAQR